MSGSQVRPTTFACVCVFAVTEMHGKRDTTSKSNGAERKKIKGKKGNINKEKKVKKAKHSTGQLEVRVRTD